MERFKKPQLTEILDAITEDDAPSDWCIDILSRAEEKDIKLVYEMMKNGSLLKEIRLELEIMEK